MKNSRLKTISDALFRRAIFLALSIFVTSSAWSTTLPEHDAQVTLVADVRHGDTQVLQQQVAYFREVLKSDPSFNCLVLEIDQHAEAGVKRFLQGEDYSTSIQPWMEKVEKHMGSKALNVIPDWYLLENDKLGLQIFGGDIDHTQSGDSVFPEALKRIQNPFIEKHEDDVKLLVESRNLHMANRVARLLKQKECKKAFVVFGNAHLEDKIFRFPVISTQAYMTQLGLKVHVVKDVGLEPVLRLEQELRPSHSERLAFHAQ